MCGRINVHDSEAVQLLMDYLGLPLYPLAPPRYNITPTSSVPVLTGNSVEPMTWGIEFGKFRHPNSRFETIEKKSYLQKLLIEQRCVVPVNRFYEWPDRKYRPEFKNIKTRFCIHTPDDVMFFGGLYKLSSDGSPQFNIITTTAVDEIDRFHKRMPIMIPPDQVKDWFEQGSVAQLAPLMVPYKGELSIYECSAYVDNGRHDGPECMEPIAEHSA